MTKKELKALPYDQLVDVCYKQEREFCKLNPLYRIKPQIHVVSFKEVSVFKI